MHRIILCPVMVSSAVMSSSAAQEVLLPCVGDKWWQAAGDPDLGDYASEKQQPVDFGVWQASDGAWQLWSCVRGTRCGGNTRLFYRWEGQHLTDSDWKPMGIAMEARPELGETPGGLQAPHVVRHNGKYYMAYGDWVNICFAASTDGKNFERVTQPDGRTGVFSEGPEVNTRDPMLINIDGLWHCYYTGYVDGKGYGWVRTSPDLRTWSDSAVVAYGGQAGNGPSSAECPFVVEPEPGHFYLFRTQRYGQDAQTSVYHSTNPLYFGIDDDRGLVCRLPVAAPEIIKHQGRYYIAYLNPGLDGIRIARLDWRRGEQT